MLNCKTITLCWLQSLINLMTLNLILTFPSQSYWTDIEKKPQKKNYLLLNFTSSLLQLYYLAKHLSTRRPATTLAQAIDEPEQWEHVNSGGPGEDNVDAPNQEQTNREKPAGAYLIGHHTTDELADRVGHGLATGDQACRETTRLQLTGY